MLCIVLMERQVAEPVAWLGRDLGSRALGDIPDCISNISELVPLSFNHSEAPMFLKRLVPGLRKGPTNEAVLRMCAFSRLMLHGYIDHVQAS